MSIHSSVFVAYTAQDKDVAALIEESVRKANATPNLPVHYEPWIVSDVPGQLIPTSVMDKIEASRFIIADITHLNLNVVYEIGLAIGRGKRVFLIRHSSTEGDSAIAQEVGIFDTLGFHKYKTVDDLKRRLISHIDEVSLSFNLALNRKAPIYIVEPPTRNTAATMTASRVKKAGYKYRSFLPSEDTRLAADNAVRQVAESSGVILLLQEASINGSNVHNIRVMFVAGLAHGMGKPTLILATAGYSAPIDIRDVIKSYRYPDDISDRIADFCLQIHEHLQQADPLPIETHGLLQRISMGDPTAENEVTTLSDYFLATDQYERAVRGETNLVVGRKGSGKTALFIMLCDKIMSDKRNIVVDLKPEGYQLKKLKEEILSYLTSGAQEHLITAFWEYLILLEVANKLLEKDKETHKFNHDIYEHYLELQVAYRVDGFVAEGDFSERLLALSERISVQYAERFGAENERRLTSQEVTELLYTHDLRKLRNRVARYLEKTQSVWVLFDNLDRGWSTQGIDSTDTIILRCLIDAGRKIEREMQRASYHFRCIVFVRNDVYEQLMANSTDYGKEMRTTLDWTEPDLLREMLRLRLISGLDKHAAELPFKQLWSTICTSHIQGEESSSYIIDRSLMRPRNVLKIFNHACSSANNFGREKINKEDFEKGLRVYSRDLLIEIDRELSDIYPKSKGLIYHFMDSLDLIDKEELVVIIRESGIRDEDSESIIDFLLYCGVLGVFTGKNDFFIFDVGYDLTPLKIRAARAGANARYRLNPAFAPALGVEKTPSSVGQVA